MAEITDYIQVLKQENEVLSTVLAKQQKLREVVNAKDWTALMKVVSEINLSMDEFNRLDEIREAVAVSADTENEEAAMLLCEVRGKLVRCRTENKVLGDYINITRNFVKGIIDSALPQSKAKVYSRNGSFVQEQPRSVVLNALL